MLHSRRNEFSPAGKFPSKPLDAAIHWVPAPFAPAATMVDKFKWNTQNSDKTQLLASENGTFWSLVVYENFGTQNGSTTYLLIHRNANYGITMSWCHSWHFLLYSAHWCNKLRLNVKCHDWSWRAWLHFYVSNVARGQKLEKLLSDHEARFISWRICAPLVVKLLSALQLNRFLLDLWFTHNSELQMLYNCQRLSFLMLM